MNTKPKHLKATDLRATARLASQATAGLVDLVEAVHARIATLPLTGPASQRTRGITGLVYNIVRGVSHGVGSSVDALLGLLEPAVQNATPGLATPEREAVIAVLNGVLGDHLAATGSPLAISMALRVRGQALHIQRDSLAAALPQATGRVLVLLHGLCMNDLQWQRDGHEHQHEHGHGAMLAREAGWTPLYLHYNSGLHIASNGQQLALLLQQLTAAWPRPITQLALLGHSMGGLVARSAIHCAQQAGMAWPAQLTDLVCLGSPHHGAPLERAGHGVDLLLNATPYSAPFKRLGQLRSAGITDLRHGYLLASDGQKNERRTPVPPIPLPVGVRSYAMAATLAQRGDALKQRVSHAVLGDGLVPLDSALGRHPDPQFDLGFAADKTLVVHGIGHLDLLSHAEVAEQIKRWLR